jgi:hypothetical protein
MPKIAPLTIEQAKRTLAFKLSGKVGPLRQIATKLGLRPYRVFLVWTKFTADERGAGDEREVLRKEILPTPRVENLDAVSYTPYAVGIVPVGSIRVTRVSAREFTADMLRGRATNEDRIDEPYSFFYEVVEDGRNDSMPIRMKYRLSATPFLQAGKTQWVLLLERISEDRDRSGESKLGQDDD